MTSGVVASAFTAACRYSMLSPSLEPRLNTTVAMGFRSPRVSAAGTTGMLMTCS